MKRTILIAIEVVLLVIALSFAILWITKSDGGFEPYVIVATLLLIGVDIYRRYSKNESNRNNDAEPSGSSSSSEKSEVTEFTYGDETIQLRRSMRTNAKDVVVIDAFEHRLGIMAEYDWLEKHYPGYEREQQALVSLGKLADKKLDESEEKYFDRVKIVKADGKRKEIWFDITSYFGGGPTTSLDLDDRFKRKLLEIYDL